MHIRYYLKRIEDKKQFKNENKDLLNTMKENYPKVYQCSLKIADLIGKAYKAEIIEEEILYLMIHINRIVQTTILKD